MKFVEVADNYIVNLDAIFSLERREINDPDVQEEFDEAVGRLTESITENPPELDCGGILFKPTPENAEDELFLVYKENLRNYLEDKIRYYKDTITYEYFAVLSTGMKVKLSYSKWKAIIDAIS